LAQLLGRRVSVGFVSAASPRLADAVNDARRGAAGGRVVLATYLLAPGYFAELASGAGADLVAAPLLRADDAVPGELIDVILDRFSAACNADVSTPSQTASDAVTTW
jgi:sirohydrochlorin ferrochelatase